MTARWQIHHQSYSRRLETAVWGSLGLLWLLLPPFLLSFLCSVYAQSLLQLISLICALRLTCWWGWRGAGWSPLGTIDGSPSHTPLMGGQIDSWDAHSGTSRCYHCVFVSVCILCTLAYMFARISNLFVYGEPTSTPSRLRSTSFSNSIGFLK